MAEDSDLEKTEQATPKRLEKAREDGDVPRSRELATVTVLFAAGLSFWMMGGHLSRALKTSMQQGLSFNRAEVYDATKLFIKISEIIFNLLVDFAPFALVLLVVAIASPALIGGWVMSSKALTPQFNRLNPAKGLGNMFSKNSAVELVKSIAKALLVSSVAYMVVSSEMEPMLLLSTFPIATSVSQTGQLLITGFLSVVGALVLIAAIDVPFQLYQYANKLKMTKEEVRKEAKESDGNPEIKARVRQLQREMARRRMMSEVPKADVVITNPTHYAVAIQYQEHGNRAPVVIAKGADATALKIREIAKEHHIVTLEAPKLARAIYAHTDLNAEIPETLYTAVAEVLAYVFQLRVFNKEGGFRPDVPKALPVPDELDPHSLLPAPYTVKDEEVFAS